MLQPVLRGKIYFNTVASRIQTVYNYLMVLTMGFDIRHYYKEQLIWVK